jgi:hypothetical protein
MVNMFHECFNLKRHSKLLSSLNALDSVTKKTLIIQSIEVEKRRVINVICRWVHMVTKGPT